MAVTKTISFANRQGDIIAGKLDMPAGQMRGTALFAHCFTCSKDSLAAARLSQHLAMTGIAVLRFDFTGLGQSTGDFGSSGFAGNLQDIEDACAWLGVEVAPPTILIGHSLGGAAVLAIAQNIASIKGVAVIGAPAHPAHVLHLFGDAANQTHADEDRLKVSIGARPFEVSASFLKDLKARNSIEHIASLSADLLILHAPTDAIVGIENAAEIFQKAKHPKSFVSLDRADHLLTNKADAQFAAMMISSWAERLISKLVEQPHAAEGEVVVASSPDGLFAHNIACGAHLLRADEPSSIEGGLDSGPAPYEFLLAGLGACTAMTLRLYAARKNWPLETVDVHLQHEKQHRKDAAIADGGRLDKMTRTISMTGGLDEAQRARLLEIADKCPVHKTLESGIDIHTKSSA